MPIIIGILNYNLSIFIFGTTIFLYTALALRPMDGEGGNEIKRTLGYYYHCRAGALLSIDTSGWAIVTARLLAWKSYDVASEFNINICLLTMKKIIKIACAVIMELYNWLSAMYWTPGPANSNLISTENAVPTSPENKAKIRYNIPMSLALHDKNHRSVHMDICCITNFGFLRKSLRFW